MDIKVLGTGHANCRTTLALTEQAAQARGVTVALGTSSRTCRRSCAAA